MSDPRHIPQHASPAAPGDTPGEPNRTHHLFAVVPMTRWRAVVLQRDLPAVLQALGSRGIVEFTPCPAGPGSAPLAPCGDSAEHGRFSRKQEAIRELRRELAAVSADPTTAPPEGSPGSLAPASDTAVEALLQRFRTLNAQREQWREQLAHQEEAEREAADFCGAEVPWTALRRTNSLLVMTGSIPEASWPDLEITLGDVAVVAGLGHHDGRRWFLLISTPTHEDRIRETLAGRGFQPQAVPTNATASTEVRSDAAGQAQDARSKLAELEAEIGRLAHEARPALDAAEQAARDEARCLQARDGMPRTETAVLLSGWVPREEEDPLRSTFTDATRGRFAFERTGSDPEPRGAASAPDEMPVLLRHPRWLRPLALLLTPYGWPRPDELVPTLFLGLGYLFMFGMMFGDVGHGALLVLAALWGGHRYGSRSGPARDAWRLVGSAGVASVLFGFLYGSCFGVPRFKHLAWWRDPLEGDPLELVELALGIGIATLTLGLILNFLNLVRRGDFAGAALDRFGAAGLLFYACGIGLVMRGLSGRGSPGDSGVPWLMIGAGLALAAWWVREPLRHLTQAAEEALPTEEGWMPILAQSTVEVFEGLLLYLANTVSFVRLAAYALSHAAILSASFLLAENVASVPVWGPLAASGVIVAGNAVALVIEGVIAAVQALRLQYYEFFGKFYSGAGRPFAAFCLSPLSATPQPS